MRRGRQPRRHEPPRVIGGSPTITAYTADRLLDDYVTPERLQIDLTETQFIDPYGMVLLLCLAAEAKAADTKVEVQFPDHKGCCSNMSRMRLHKRLNEVGAKVAGARNVREHDLEEGQLYECHQFERAAFEDLVGQLGERMVRYGYHAMSIDELTVALYEIGGNIEEHADTYGGFLAAQTFKQDTREEYMVIAVGDVGIGIRQSLMSGDVRADSELDALEKAMQPGVSSVKANVRGYGFEHMTDAVTGLRGTLFVRSDGAKATVTRTGNTVSSKVRSVGRLGGTIVAARIPCANWRTLKEVS